MMHLAELCVDRDVEVVEMKRLCMFMVVVEGLVLNNLFERREAFVGAKYLHQSGEYQKKKGGWKNAMAWTMNFEKSMILSIW